MARVYLLYDARACGDCGQNGPPDEATVMVSCDSDKEARSYAGEFGDMACFSYELTGSRRQPKTVDERWEWDWYVRGGFNDGGGGEVMAQINSYEVSIAGPYGERFHPETINAASRAAAMYDRWLNFKDAGWDIPWTRLRCRKLGEPRTPDSLIRVAAMRGVPWVRSGQRVRHDGDCGTVVGANESACFEVLFDADSRHPLQTLPVHPGELTYLGG